MKSIYTKEDLGVTAIVENGNVTEEAKNAVKRITGYDSSAIMQALIQDCPYELYWYDKIEGCIVGGPTYSYSASRVTISGDVYFKLTVAEEYQDNNEYLVNIGYGTSVTRAVNKARSIVSKYDGWDDYPRLLAYKNAICDLASYNNEAGLETAYGNPWQLVWVFDGDPDTKVVCEGYAKAFQYLNDLSSSRVTVLCASGKMNDQDHMWNVVKMEDGFNYLADLTNCDTGMIGYPEALFLTGYISTDGNHEYTYQANSRDITYMYNATTLGTFAAAELAMMGNNYLDTAVEVPVFTAEKTNVLINEEVSFTKNNSEEYD